MQIEIPGRPATVNALRTGNHWILGKEIALWRETSGWIVKAARLGKAPEPCKITVSHLVHIQGRRKIPDVGAAWYAIKGCVDGLVDAGVLVDDSPAHVSGLFLQAPVKADHDGLVITIEPA